MDANAEIQRANDAARRRKNAEARAILRDVLNAEPSNIDAWVAFAGVAQKPEDAMRCLKQAARLDPSNEDVRRMLAELQTSPAAAPPEDEVSLVSSSGANRGEPGQLWRGRSLETVLLIVLVGVGCCVIALLAGLYLPKLSIISSLFPENNSPGADEITAPIYANIDASNAEDMAAYMATIHTKSPVYDQTQSTLGPLFANYDLSFEVSNVEVLEQSKNEARVAFILITRKIRGPAFNNNQVKGVMILRPENSAWKIYNQEVQSIEYLK
jgi:hypothetical protein